MKKTLFLFLTISFLALGNGTAVGMLHTTHNPVSYRAVDYNGSNNDYRKMLSSKSRDELKQILTSLIIPATDDFPDPNDTADKITLVMQAMDKLRPPLIFTADDIQLLNNLIILNGTFKGNEFEVPELIGWMLNHSMPINTITAPENQGGSQTVPLLIAIQTKKPKIVELLLKNGANQHIQLFINNPTIPTTPRLEAQRTSKYTAAVEIMEKYDKLAAPSSAVPASGVSSSPKTAPLSTATPYTASSTVTASHAPSGAHSTPRSPDTSKNFEERLATITTQNLGEYLENLIKNGADSDQISKTWQEIIKRDTNPPYQITFADPKILTELILDATDLISTDQSTIEMILGLIDRGIPVDGVDQVNHNALWNAITTKNTSLVLELLKRGANQNIKMDFQSTVSPREIALERAQTDSTYPQAIIDSLNQYDTTQQKVTSFKWNITKGKIVAALISAGWIAGLYRWWTGNQSAEYKQNVLINTTGTDIFIRGSQESIAPNATYLLPESGIIWIKLNKDQDDTKDLKIDMADYADDIQDSYLNLTIRKKWFSNWFTVPLFASEHWVDRE